MRPAGRPAPAHGDSRPLLSRLGWFVAYWLLGVGTVTIVGFGIRFWLR